jgi:hypothetical protein
VGSTIFDFNDAPLNRRWLHMFSNGRVPLSDGAAKSYALLDITEDTDPATLALFIGATWTTSDVQDLPLRKALALLSDYVENIAGKEAIELNTLSFLLLRLAPSVHRISFRPKLRKALTALVADLHKKIENRAALFADAPWMYARAAAALLSTEPRRINRARELLFRAEKGVVSIVTDKKLEGGREDAEGDDHFGAAAALALAQIRQGNDAGAFALLRSLARFLHLDADISDNQSTVDESDQLSAEAAAAALAFSKPLPNRATVVVDGRRYTVALQDGVGSVKIPALGTGGRHRIEVDTGTTDIVLLQARNAYLTDWSVPPANVGPFATRIEGAPGNRNERAEYRLVIRNRIPRFIPEPVVEISLPAGVEMDETCRSSLSPYLISEPSVTADRLTLRLRPMRPQEQRVIPLPWRWTAAGELTGLSILSYAADRPQAISVSQPKTVSVSNRAPKTGGTP